MIMYKDRKCKIFYFIRISLSAGQFVQIFSTICLLFTLSITASCVRKIENTPGLLHPFKQGTADNLYVKKTFQILNSDNPSDKINKIDWNRLKDKAIQIETDKTARPAKILTDFGDITIDSKVSFINQYYFVKYHPKSELKTSYQKKIYDLLGTVNDFKGFPNTVYYILPYLKNKHLILFRVANKNKIPYDEYFSGIPIDDDQIATPVVSYPIQYCKAEVIRNENNEDTGQYRPKCEGVSQSKAEYIRFNTEKKQIFYYEKKIDIFPRNFFDGNWFFTWTVIRSNENTATRIGQHIGMTNARLIKFKKEAKQLIGIDISGVNMEDKDKKQAMSIPILWQEYKINTLHNLSEMTDNTKEDIKRPYFKILFNQLVSARNGNTSLKSVTITDTYFSYTYDIRNQNNFKTVKVAFLKRNTKGKQPYQQKQWIEEDSNHFFPSFEIIRDHYQDASTHTKQGRDLYFRVVRFNPNKKIIKWYFSKNTPKSPWIRNFGRQAVHLWDKAFTKAAEGTGKKPIKIVLDDTRDQELGDNRFNILNLIETKTEQKGFTLLGVGPNMANPVTGEMISATANVFITSIIDIYIRFIRQYVRYQLFPPLWKWLPSSPGITDYLYESIQILCPKVSKFIELNKGKSFHPQLTQINDKDIIKECSQKIAEPIILSTVLHEMGHTFSLRHVFSASADLKNTYTDWNEITDIFGKNILNNSRPNSHPHPAQFSSVMDYEHIGYPSLTVPGKYDIAAIRFIHYDTIQTKTGKMLHITPRAGGDEKIHQKSIQQTLDKHNAQIKPYKVCGGLKHGDSNIGDYLCRAGDYGTTLLEVVQNHIRTFKDFTSIMLKRYDSADINVVSFSIIATTHRIAESLKEIWNEWLRKRNRAMNLHKMSVYDYDEKNIKEYLNFIKEEANKNPEFNQYYQIRQVIFDFYKEVLFLPIKKCIFTKKDGSYYSESIYSIVDRLKGQYSQANQTVIYDCLSPAVLKWSKENELNFVTEVGLSGLNKSYFVPVNPAIDRIDELSIFTNSNRNVILDHLGQIMDEPDFRKELEYEAQQYFLKGQDITPYINESPQSEQIKKYFSKNRILTYETDMMDTHTENLTYNPFYYFVQLLFSTAEEVSSFATGRVQQKAYTNYTCTDYNIIDLINQTTPLISTNSLPENIMPFLHTIYQEYSATTEPKDIETHSTKSFWNNMVNHPKILKYKKHPNMVCIPQIEQSFIASLIEKYNTYNTCINEASIQTPCENKHNKVAFVKQLEKYPFSLNKTPPWKKVNSKPPLVLK